MDLEIFYFSYDIKAYCINNVVVNIKPIFLGNIIYLRVTSIVHIKSIDLFFVCFFIVIKEKSILLL